MNNQLAEHAPPKLLGWIRFPDGSYRLVKRYLRPVQPRARRWWESARKQFTHGAAIDSPPAQHSLLKQLRGPWRKHAEMGAADPPKGVQKPSIPKLNWIWEKIFRGTAQVNSFDFLISFAAFVTCCTAQWRNHGGRSRKAKESNFIQHVFVRFWNQSVLPPSWKANIPNSAYIKVNKKMSNLFSFQGTPEHQTITSFDITTQLVLTTRWGRRVI